MAKKIALFSILLLGAFFLLFPAGPLQAVSAEINFFYSPSCPHCAEEKVFLSQLEEEYSELTVNRFSVTTEGAVARLKEFYRRYQVPQEEWGMVPITFIDGSYAVGYNGEIGVALENRLQEILNSSGEKPVPLEPSESSESSEQSKSSENLDKNSSRSKLNFPFLGEIDVSVWSPLVLSVVVGALDGFNPCAMIALGFLLALLVATGIRKRVFWVGGVFILVSGIVYFLFISAWLNLFIFLGYLKIITVGVSLVIIVFALALLKDYFHGVVCRICRLSASGQSRLGKIERSLFSRMNCLVSSNRFALPVVLLGVAAIAAGVNLIELFCSFGFPLAYTKILTSYQLNFSQYYFYLLIYIVFYMLDDLLIFAIAVATLRITNFNEKYLKTIKLVSALVLLALGLIMFFKPEILMS